MLTSSSKPLTTSGEVAVSRREFGIACSMAMPCAHARDVVRRALAVLGSLEAACAAMHTAETEGRPGVPRRVPCEQSSQVRATSCSDRQLATCLGRAADACEAGLQLAGPAQTASAAGRY